MINELQVQQIELEMQNDEGGMIMEVNLTATKMMGVADENLVRQPITRFILPESQDIFYLRSKRLFAVGEAQIAHHGIIEAEVNFIQKAFSVSELAEKLRGVLPGTRSDNQGGTGQTSDGSQEQPIRAFPPFLYKIVFHDKGQRTLNSRRDQA